MTWSYTGDPSDSTKDAVRFLVGDTDTNDQLISDEEISYLASEHGSINRTASEAARAIAAKFARNMSRSIGGLQADFAAKYRQYLELADSLLTKEETDPVSPFISGYKKDQKQGREDDTNREKIFGRKGGMDNKRAASVDEAYNRIY
jgi:hypothetical protein